MRRSTTCRAGRLPSSSVPGMILSVGFWTLSHGCVGGLEGELADSTDDLVQAVLEVESGARSGTLDRPWGAIMDGAGDRVCWSGVAMGGVSGARLRYSNGEGPG